jgi:hypothetical protein
MLKMNLTNFKILKGNTSSSYRHSTNMATLRQFDLTNEKPVACLFPLLFMALPMVPRVFEGSPSSPFFSELNHQS